MFVHAGVALGKPSSQQSAQDLLWIRSGFADRDSPFEKVVVHGHTIVEQPYVGRYRIAVDTGAYASGVLSGLVLENVERRILTSSL